MNTTCLYPCANGQTEPMPLTDAQILVMENSMTVELAYNQFDVLMSLIILGFTIGVVVMVMSSAIRIGWNLAPWIFVGAMVLWFLNG